MTRTPLSIIREVRDSRRTGASCRQGNGAGQASPQPNLVTANQGLEVGQQAVQRGSRSQTRQPSRSSATQSGKRAPSPPRLSETTKDLGQRRRAPSAPAPMPPVSHSAFRADSQAQQRSFWNQPQQPRSTESAFSATTEGCRSPPRPVFDRGDQRHDEFGGSTSSSQKFRKDSPKQPEEPIRKGRRGSRELSLAQALDIQQELRIAFSDTTFQDALKRLQSNFPQRKTRGHSDGPAFFESFERLTLAVYHAVLPKWGFNGDWDGLRDFHNCMEAVKNHASVKEFLEEINTLMGLPRDAVFRPQKRKDELLVHRPDGDGCLPDWLLLPKPLQTDSDGDEAHEFWEEDPISGVLLQFDPMATPPQ